MAVDLKELRRRHNEQARILEEAERRAGVRASKDRDAIRKRKERAAERAVTIPPIEDLQRRLRLEADDEAWLMHYFGPESEVEDPFTYQFTFQQKEMIADFADAIVNGGDRAVAASRGEGKSTIFERLTVKYTGQGKLRYTVIFQANGRLASNQLDAIKSAFEENPLLHADYPEICVPVRALENAPQRAHYMLVNGKRFDNGKEFELQLARFSWCGQEIILPNVPGSPSGRSIIATRGLDSPVRGLKRKGRRPQLAAIDDPDTKQTATSDEHADNLGAEIDKAIGGLGTQTRPIARIMLTTIQSRKSVAYKFTDTTSKPSWRGKRYKFLIKPPARIDLWDEYIELKQEDWRNETDNAHEFFVKNRDEMERGHEVANPNRYAQGELCALQHYYNEAARKGKEYCETELDNNPPEDRQDLTEELTAKAIQFRVSGYDRYMVPPECSIVVRGIDVGKYALHYVVRGYSPEATNYTIDYAVKNTHGVSRSTDEGAEKAIYEAIISLIDEAPAYRRPSILGPNGEALEGTSEPISITLIDCRYHKDGVVAACASIGGMTVLPSMGHGRSEGCVSASFRPMMKESEDVLPGDGWYVKKDENGNRVVHCDTDRWKRFEHARWMTAVGKAGAAYLFGEISDEEMAWLSRRTPNIAKEHTTYAKHLTAEAELEEVVRGIMMRRWRTKAGRGANHYLDASYLCDVGAAMRGIRLIQPTVATSAPTPSSPAVINRGREQTPRW